MATNIGTPIPSPENFDIQKKAPIDERTWFETIAARDLLPLAVRYEGLECYVKDPFGNGATAAKVYRLIGGETNDYWTEMPISSVGGASTLEGLIDVVYPQALSNGQVLTYNNGSWGNATGSWVNNNNSIELVNSSNTVSIGGPNPDGYKLNVEGNSRVDTLTIGYDTSGIAKETPLRIKAYGSLAESADMVRISHVNNDRFVIKGNGYIYASNSNGTAQEIIRPYNTTAAAVSAEYWSTNTAGHYLRLPTDGESLEIGNKLNTITWGDSTSGARKILMSSDPYSNNYNTAGLFIQDDIQHQSTTSNDIDYAALRIDPRMRPSNTNTNIGYIGVHVSPSATYSSRYKYFDAFRSDMGNISFGGQANVGIGFTSEEIFGATLAIRNYNDQVPVFITDVNSGAICMHMRSTGNTGIKTVSDTTHALKLGTGGLYTPTATVVDLESTKTKINEHLFKYNSVETSVDDRFYTLCDITANAATPEDYIEINYAIPNPNDTYLSSGTVKVKMNGSNVKAYNVIDSDESAVSFRVIQTGTYTYSIFANLAFSGSTIYYNIKRTDSAGTITVTDTNVYEEVDLPAGITTLATNTGASSGTQFWTGSGTTDIYRSSGKVGIGVAPDNLDDSVLQVVGNTNTTGIAVLSTTASSKGSIRASNGYSFIVRDEANSVDRITVDDSGHVSIGTPQTQYDLGVDTIGARRIITTGSSVIEEVAINNLSKVSTTAPSDGYVLTYDDDNSEYVPKAIPTPVMPTQYWTEDVNGIIYPTTAAIAGAFGTATGDNTIGVKLTVQGDTSQYGDIYFKDSGVNNVSISSYNRGNNDFLIRNETAGVDLLRIHATEGATFNGDLNAENITLTTKLDSQSVTTDWLTVNSAARISSMETARLTEVVRAATNGQVLAYNTLTGSYEPSDITHPIPNLLWEEVNGSLIPTTASKYVTVGGAADNSAGVALTVNGITTLRNAIKFERLTGGDIITINADRTNGYSFLVKNATGNVELLKTVEGVGTTIADGVITNTITTTNTIANTVTTTDAHITGNAIVGNLSTSKLSSVGGNAPTDGDYLTWNAAAAEYLPSTLDTAAFENTLGSDITTTVEVGGIAANTSITSSTALKTILIDMLSPYIGPEFTSFNVTTSQIASELEIGTTALITAADWTINTDSAGAVPANITITGEGFTNNPYTGLSATADPGASITNNAVTTETWSITGFDAQGASTGTQVFTKDWYWGIKFGASATVVVDTATAQTVYDAVTAKTLSSNNTATFTCTSENNTSTLFTYLFMPVDLGDITNALLNGAAPVYGAFTKVGLWPVNNANGISHNIYVYKSNASGAFSTGDTISFS